MLLYTKNHKIHHFAVLIRAPPLTVSSLHLFGMSKILLRTYWSVIVAQTASIATLN
jgi:hypothetical protein